MVTMTSSPVENSASVLESTDSLAHSPKDAVKTASIPAHAKERSPEKLLIVIDPGVDDYQALAAGAIEGATVAVLDADRNGIDQITELLKIHSDVHSLHLVSHGTAGCLHLGSAQLTLETIDRYAWDLQNWFSDSAPLLLIYGCNVAAEAIGAKFLSCLHRLTGAAIAASTTRTGSAALGGNWNLEVSIGKIEAPLAFDAATMETYSAVFALSDTFDAQDTKQALDTELTKIQQILDGQILGTKLPITGALSTVAPGFVSTLKTSLLNGIGSTTTFSVSGFATTVQNSLQSVFPNLQVTPSDDANGGKVVIKTGKTYSLGSVSLATDLGTPGLGITTTGTGQGSFDYGINLGVGFDKTLGGFYFDTDNTSLNANVNFGLSDNFSASGRMGFLQLDLTDDAANKTSLGATFSAKLKDLDNIPGAPDDGAKLTTAELKGSYQLSNLFDTSFAVAPKLGLQAITSYKGSTAMPSFNLNLGADWQALSYANGVLTKPQTPTVSFNNMQLDLGTFVNDFARPVLTRINDVVSPFRPVVKFMNSEVGVFNKLSPLKKLFDQNGDGTVKMIEVAGVMAGRTVDTRFLDGLSAIDDVTTKLNQITNTPGNLKIDFGSYSLGGFDASSSQSNLSTASTTTKAGASGGGDQAIAKTAGSTTGSFLQKLKSIPGLSIPILDDQITNTPGNLKIDFGSYSLGGFDASSSQSNLSTASTTTKAGASGGGDQAIAKTAGSTTGSFLQKLKSIPGLSIPILDDPKSALGIVLGKPDVNLFSYDMPDFDESLTISKDFPIWGPLSGNLTGSLRFRTNLAFGYDTYGLSQWKNSGFTGAGAVNLVDGFYVVDQPGNELQLDATLSAGGRLNLVAAKGSLDGGVRGNVGIDLVDVGEAQGRSDGKLRTTEITSRLSRPQDLFNVNGSINAFLSAKVEYWKPKPRWTNPFNGEWQKAWGDDLATYQLASFSAGAPNGGRVSNKYVSGATIYLDANLNGIQEQEEPFTISNSDGTYNLEIPMERYDRDQNGKIDPTEGRIISEGGTDVFTFMPIKTVMTASADSQMVTPVTTLVEELVTKGESNATAQNEVKNALHLPGVNLNVYDPIAGIAQGDQAGTRMMIAHVEIQDMLTETTVLLKGEAVKAHSHLTEAEISGEVAKAIAAQIKQSPGKTLHLNSAKDIQQIIHSSAELLAKDKHLNLAQSNELEAGAAKLIAADNAQIETLQKLKGERFLVEISMEQAVIQEHAAADLEQVGKGHLDIDKVLKRDAGDGLSSEIKAERALVNSKLLLGNSHNNRLNGTKNNDVALAAAGNDKVFGGLGNDMLSGDEGNDLVMGGDGDDTVMGDTGNDKLFGGAGNDTLVGGFNRDLLTGGAGKDKFVLNGAGTGMNQITDFSAKDDVLQVAQIDYQVNRKGVLAVGQFHLGAHAADRSDRFIYNSKSGALFYDADGSGAGKQMQIAQLSAHPSLTNRDIVVV